MADTSGFVTGDDFIGFDFNSPSAGPSRSGTPASPASSVVSTGNVLGGLTRSPPPGWKGKGKAPAQGGSGRDESDGPSDFSSSGKAKGKKRKSSGLEPETKRSKNDPQATGPRNLKEERKAAERAAPWADDVRWERCIDSSEMLNDEIHAFYKYMRPTPDESRVRAQMIDLIANTILSRWPDAEVLPFGSWQTELYLPTGDIDLVVTTPRLIVDEWDVHGSNRTKVRLLRELASMMRNGYITQDVAVISKAKVPIIKFVTLDGKINVDISLNHPDTVSNGVQSAKIIQHYLDDLPGARELILVVKAFLSQRSMNEVYTGGLGSYSVIILVISFLQLHPKLRRSEMDARKNLGTLLCEFFELYGRNFNYDHVGISIRRGGTYYSKLRRGWANFNNQPFLLSIEDPQDPENDVAKSSHGIRQVKMTLAGAYDLLTATLFKRAEMINERRDRGEYDPMDPQEVSILATIMGVTKETQKFRRELAQLAASGHLARKLNNLLSRMGNRAVIVSRDAASGGGSGSRDEDAPDANGPQPQVIIRRTPPPPTRPSDPVGAILVDDDSSVASLASDTESEALSSSSDESEPRQPGRPGPQVDRDVRTYRTRQATKPKRSPMEDGEIASDSKYAAADARERKRLKNREKRKRKQAQRRAAAAVVSVSDGGETTPAPANGAVKGKKAKPKPRSKSAPGSKLPSRAGSDAGDGAAPTASAHNATSVPVAVKTAPGTTRLTAEERKAFWAAKGGVTDAEPVDEV